jgi:hypothetical protein
LVIHSFRIAVRFTPFDTPNGSSFVNGEDCCFMKIVIIFIQFRTKNLWSVATMSARHLNEILVYFTSKYLPEHMDNFVGTLLSNKRNIFSTVNDKFGF